AYQPQDMGIYGIYTSRQHMSPLLRTMLDFLLDWFATDDQWLAAIAAPALPGRPLVRQRRAGAVSKVP
ncbi:MAG: LysR family transcriptional regulator, partial [Janthinobacterium sp.]